MLKLIKKREIKSKTNSEETNVTNVNLLQVQNTYMMIFVLSLRFIYNFKLIVQKSILRYW